MSGRVVIVSPHFDDAVLSCWHVLEGPGDVIVVNVFTGSPPPGTPLPWWDMMTGASDPAERMRERRAEDRAALALAGRRAIALGLLDDQYRDPADAAPDVSAALAAVLAPGVALYAPAAFDGHPDHVLARDAALALAADGHPVMLYADLPHGIARGWPAWVSGEPAADGADIGDEWQRRLGEAGLAVERLVPRVRPLDPETRARKLRALDVYATQRAALDDYAFVPLADPRGLAFEVAWEVPVAALAPAG